MENVKLRISIVNEVILLVNTVLKVLLHCFICYVHGLVIGGSISSQSSQNDTPRVVLVFFLGGCTFAEVSALRFLSQQEDCKCKVILNNHIIFLFMLHIKSFLMTLLISSSISLCVSR
jgi:hypothetical protein